MQVHFTLKGRKVAIRKYSEIVIPNSTDYIRLIYQGVETTFRVERRTINYSANTMYIALKYIEIVRK